MRTLLVVLAAAALAAAEPGSELQSRVKEAFEKTSEAGGLELEGRVEAGSPAGMIVGGMGIAVEGKFKATVSGDAAGVVVENSDYRLEFYRKNGRTAKRLTLGDVPAPDFGNFAGELSRILDFEALAEAIEDGRAFKARKRAEVGGEECSVVAFKLPAHVLEDESGGGGAHQLMVLRDVAVTVWIGRKEGRIRKLQVKAERGYSDMIRGAAGEGGGEKDGTEDEDGQGFDKAHLMDGMRFSNTYTLSVVKSGKDCRVDVPEELRGYLED